MVSTGWSFTNVPDEGLSDITFPFTVSDTPHEKGYYYAMQYNFVDVKDVGYAGVQPIADEDGQSMIHATFSSFAEGTTSSDANCNAGADGGPGYSCAINVAGNYDNTFNVVIKNTQGTTWEGTLVDTVSGDKHSIGVYTLPSGAGGIKDNQVGFMEDFIGVESCDKTRKAAVTFGVPTTTTSNAVGSLDEPYEYGDCVGKNNYKVSGTSDKEYKVSIGFV